MDESILSSIKKLLGMPEDDTSFDSDIIMHINSVFSILNQIGVGPDAGFSIKDAKSVWSDFLQDMSKMEMVKSYIHLKVRILFDPPLSSVVLESMNRMVSEFECRLAIAANNNDDTT